MPGTAVRRQLRNQRTKTALAMATAIVLASSSLPVLSPTTIVAPSPMPAGSSSKKVHKKAPKKKYAEHKPNTEYSKNYVAGVY